MSEIHIIPGEVFPLAQVPQELIICANQSSAEYAKFNVATGRHFHREHQDIKVWWPSVSREHLRGYRFRRIIVDSGLRRLYTSSMEYRSFMNFLKAYCLDPVDGIIIEL